jgi:glycerol-3-phosphate acyltransferase PlsY
MDFRNFILLAVGVAIGSYLIGGINCSILISKLFKKDVRNVGSGNAGATNMVRAFGPGIGIATMLGDFLKTLIALLATRFIFAGEDYWQAMVAFSGFFCSMGHAFPIYFGFRGGKAVTVVGMVFLVVDWRCFAIGISVFILTVILSRFISLGSMLAGISGPITMCFLPLQEGVNRWHIVSALAALALMVICLHRQNVVRLIKGEERIFTFKKD